MNSNNLNSEEHCHDDAVRIASSLQAQAIALSSFQRETCPNVLRQEFYNNQDGCRASLFVQVHPGFEMQLRSSRETQNAIYRGFTRFTQCNGCTLSIGCVRDAHCVLCPCCYTVTSLEAENQLGAPLTPVSYGLGLGFAEDLSFYASSECTRNMF